MTPVFRGTQHFYSMNSLDQIFWGLGAFTLVSLIRTGDRRFWILLGFVLGLGLLNKISILWLGTAIGVGLLLTPLRRCLATRWPWIALGIALLVFLPHLIWQAAWNFPTLDFVRNAKALKMVSHSPLEFLSNQILLMNAAAVPLFLAGLALWPVMREMRRWVILPVIFLTVLVILLASGSNKGYYLAAAYPFAIIPGAEVLERVLARGLWRGVGWLYAIVVVLVVSFPTVPGKIGRPPTHPQQLYADAGYDSDPTRSILRWLGIEPHIRRRGSEHGSHLGRVRWVVERTISWIKGLRRMRVRYDRSGVTIDAWTSVAAAVVCLNIFLEATT